MTKKNSSKADLMAKLRDPEFAANYIMAWIVADVGFLPVALGDVAKAHGVAKLANETGINRRTLYKIFDKQGNPSFELVSRIVQNLGLEVQIRPQKRRKPKSEKSQSQP